MLLNRRVHRYLLRVSKGYMLIGYTVKTSDNFRSLFIWRNTMAKMKRPDRDGAHRAQFDRNKKKIYATQTLCGICGKPVDFTKKMPHPLSPCIDHIIPVSKGGHPSALDNLQLAHMTCNRQKSDKFIERKAVAKTEEVISNRILPHSVDWKNFRTLQRDKDING